MQVSAMVRSEGAVFSLHVTLSTYFEEAGRNEDWLKLI